MTDFDRAALDRILCDALDLEGEERARYLQRACDGDDALRDAVDRMLSAALSEDGLLREGELQSSEDWAAVADSLDQAAEADPGDRIGPFQLVDVLGRGGMGVVWRARRADGAFEQDVALKLIRSGHSSSDLARRLLRERQILARLTHPGIAHLVDGGLDHRSRPWFAMELVEGKPLLEYCAENRLSRDERLTLFIEVADTVQYAHQHLLVHRDIKPANVLVTDEGSPKLLDFGIAKLLDASMEESSLTQTRHQPLTPRYASPEQLLGDSITTASDVYQLGLLLFEILTGQSAFEIEEGKASALVESARERMPAQPSRLIDVPRDLDSIVMNATRPEPDRRYSTVALLAEDVRAYLKGRPVRARGDSLGYRARRFASRHRVGVALAGSVVLMGFILTSAIAWGFVTANHERRRAEAIGAFLKDTLRGAQPFVAAGRDTALMEEILGDAAGRIDTELADRPYAAAEIHITIAETLRALSEYSRAEHHAEAAAKGFESTLGPNARETLAARQVLGLTYWDQGIYEESERILQEVFDRSQRELGPEDSVTINAAMGLGLAIRAQGRLEDAEPLYRRAMKLTIEAEGASSSASILAIGNLAFLLAELDRLEEAEPLAQRAAKLSRESLGQDHPDTYLAIDKLASLVGERGRLTEALELHREALEGMRRLLGERHSTTLGSEYATSIVLRKLGRYDESIAALERIVPIIEKDFGPESRFMFPTLLELGRSLTASGRQEDARPHLESSLLIAEKLLPPKHHLRAVVATHLADALIATGEPGRASTLLLEAREIIGEAFGAESGHRHFNELVRVEQKLRAKP